MEHTEETIVVFDTEEAADSCGVRTGTKAR